MLQQSAIEQYARRHGYVLVGVFEDIGICGLTATGERPGFHRVVQMAEASKIDTLIVHSINQIGRDLARVLPAVEWLRDQGVEILSVTERIDTSVPADAAVLAVLAALGTESLDDAALLRQIYGLRRKGRRVQEIAATSGAPRTAYE